MKFLISFCLILTAQITFAQLNARIEGDMITKERTPAGRMMISSGKFYYDTRFKKVVYDMKFPKTELYVTKDTLLYHFENNKIKTKIPTFATPETTVFHLSLVGKLKDFGLDNKNIYHLDKIEKEGNKVYITWRPDPRIKSFGAVKIMQSQGRLEGAVFFDAKGEIMAKQFFKGYKSYNGIEFPEEVTFISYKNKKEYYRVIKYHNVKINDYKNNTFYNYTLPLVR